MFFFSSRRRHTRFDCDWSSDVCSSDLRLLSIVEKATAEKAGPVRPEVEALVQLIDDEILRSRISKRKLEKILGQGQGYVASLTRGRIALKVGHVYDLAEALGLEPLLLFY